VAVAFAQTSGRARSRGECEAKSNSQPHIRRPWHLCQRSDQEI